MHPEGHFKDIDARPQTSNRANPTSSGRQVAGTTGQSRRTALTAASRASVHAIPTPLALAAPLLVFLM